MAFKDSLHRLRRAPVLHFFAIGAVLFLASTLLDGQADDTEWLSIPSSRVADAFRSFEKEIGRAPDPEERAAILERVIDEEVLFEYALALGLHREDAPQRRLAQIAAFVETVDGEHEPSELARAAVDLGLHRGDYVLRRLLVDSARRLIGDVTRAMNPSEDSLVRYLREHGEHFRTADRLRISQVLLSHSRREDPAADAVALLRRLEDGGSERAESFGDADRMPPHLDGITERDLDRRFGGSFAAQLADLPEGAWGGPVRSRYGVHLVFVRERRAGTVPPLAEVEEKVRAAWRQQETGRWIRRRLDALRANYALQIDGLPIEAWILEQGGENSRLQKAEYDTVSNEGRTS